MFEGLKEFFDRRSEALRRRRQAMHSPTVEDNQSLTDAEFWDILRQTRIESRRSGRPPEDVLIDILAEYPQEKVDQFVAMYQRLME